MGQNLQRNGQRRKVGKTWRSQFLIIVKWRDPQAAMLQSWPFRRTRHLQQAIFRKNKKNNPYERTRQPSDEGA